MNISTLLAAEREAFNVYLADRLHRFDELSEPFRQACCYSLALDGKRIRPILALWAGDLAGAPRERVLPIALALECIHTASLIHDDLPAMDDDVERRGKPTNHVVFGEANAILAGDALIVEPFALLADPLPGLDPRQQLRILKELAETIGPRGLLDGQAMDLNVRPEDYHQTYLETMHHKKTGLLIRCSLLLGALAGDLEEDGLVGLARYGEGIGLAFQIRDDLLDWPEEGDKLTFPALYGPDRAKALAEHCLEDALAALDRFGERASRLKALAHYLNARTH
ncbi:MAG: hypothetical protein A2284_07355 [Deltaproteobacteria bacterium RIFOXYA12_FULL_61_11]|nr:MAG: hypothetical protein A2284_07355 [Deltaproteobacteria bacterium RIFOXYA12_FULL_61_11]